MTLRLHVSRAWLRRALLAAVAVLVLFAASAAVVVSRSREAMAEAGARLADGDAAAARAIYERWAAWPLVGGAARAGVAVTRVLVGETDGLPRSELAAVRRRFDLTALARQALQAGRWSAVLGLASAIDSAEAHGLRAAALVELGQDGAAREALARADASPLSRRVEEVLDARSQGARTLVRDRTGVLLGWIDGEHGFVPAEPSLSELLPVAALPAAVGDGAAVRLTIDLALSRLARTALGSHRGSIVLVDPATGGILAAVSDAATVAREGGTPAFEQRREPASISKLVTSTAALRAGRDPDAEISEMTCHGHARYGGRTLWCSFPAGELSGLGHALAISCNTAFASLGERLGVDAVVGELRRYGFDRPDGLVRWGRVLAPEPSMLADLSIGLEATDITPAHGALLGAVFASGRLPEPSLVLAGDGVLGLSPAPRPAAAGEPVLDPAWLPELWRAMEAVTDEGGTAEYLDPPSFPVAMKTGTAATPGLGYHVNYVGVGPLPDPQVAFEVRVTNLGNSRTVNIAAREVASALFLGLARRFPGRSRSEPGRLTAQSAAASPVHDEAEGR